MMVMIQRGRWLTIATDLVVLFLLVDNEAPNRLLDLAKAIPSIDVGVEWMNVYRCGLRCNDI